MSRVLVLTDTHLPFQYKDWIKFVKKIYKKYNCNQIVHCGDLVDQYAFTRFIKNADTIGAKEELKRTKLELKKFFKEFPKGKLILGNHDLRLSKRALEVGIPEWALDNFRNMYQIPKDWEIDRNFEIDGVKYVHGELMSSASAALNRHSQSIVFGHNHQSAIQYKVTNRERMFALNVGCLIDIDEYAFEYARDPSGKRMFLGCGLIIDGVPYIEPVELGSKIKLK